MLLWLWFFTPLPELLAVLGGAFSLAWIGLSASLRQV